MAENREPLTFAQGDTLEFQRYLRAYLPSAGWSLFYEIRSAENPALPVIEFTSTPDATNTRHEISVASDITETWQPGESVLVGFAVNGDERHQFYYADLNLTPDLGTDANTVNVKTHAQEMVELYECVNKELARTIIQESNLQGIQTLSIKRQEARTELAYWREVRANEIAVENVANGRPSGQLIEPQFNIVQGGGYGNGFPFVPR